MLRKVMMMYEKVESCSDQLAKFQSDGVVEGFTEACLGSSWDPLLFNLVKLHFLCFVRGLYGL